MQNQNWRFLSKAIAVATLTVLVVSLSTFAAAQSDAARAIYDQSASIKTNIEGIRTFPEPAAGFNPIKASDEELAAYGIPPRPSQASDPAAYAKWARVMTAGAKRWHGELKTGWFHGTPMKSAPAPHNVSISNTATSAGSYNWSGVVNTNTLTKYNAKSSYYYIFSEFNVPTAQQAFASSGGDGLGTGGNICDGGWDVVSQWNGIDGFKADDTALLQGGTASAFYCSTSGTATEYWAWIEWYPHASVFEYDVNPGDDMYVETWNTSSTQGYVALYDLTLGIYSSYGLTAPSGSALIGNSAEFITERPCCRGDYLYPLANYVADFWDYSGDYTFNGHFNDPGATTSSTYQVFMVDDADDQVISVPDEVVNHGINQSLSNSGLYGKYSIFFQDENCSYVGGCAF